MGLIGQVFQALFGGGRNQVAEIAEVFRPNAEAASRRGHDLDAAVLDQFAAEFNVHSRRTAWDSFVDGLNRLPRPMLACIVIWMLVWTPVDPVFMSEVFAAFALVPEYMWVLIGIVVTFFFGGRSQAKELALTRDIAGMAARTQAVLAQRDAIRDLADVGEGADEVGPGGRGENPALAAILERDVSQEGK